MVATEGPEVIEDRQSNTDQVNEGIEERLQPGQLRRIQVSSLVSDLKFQPALLSKLAKKSPQSIRNWRSERSNGGPLPEYLDDVRAISIRMVRDGRIPPDQIGPWFDQRNQHLENDARPWTLIVEGRYEEVLEASRQAWIDIDTPSPEPDSASMTAKKVRRRRRRPREFA